MTGRDTLRRKAPARGGHRPQAEGLRAKPVPLWPKAMPFAPPTILLAKRAWMPGEAFPRQAPTVPSKRSGSRWSALRAKPPPRLPLRAQRDGHNDTATRKNPHHKPTPLRTNRTHTTSEVLETRRTTPSSQERQEPQEHQESRNPRSLKAQESHAPQMPLAPHPWACESGRRSKLPQYREDTTQVPVRHRENVACGQLWPAVRHPSLLARVCLAHV